jgi:PAS domain S-box-containing protein
VDGEMKSDSRGMPVACEDVIARVMEVGRLGAVVFGADRKVIWATGTLPGTATEDARGKSCSEVCAGSDRTCEPCLLELSAQEGPLRKILRLVPAGASHSRVFEVTVAPLRLPGQTEPRWLELAREIRGAEGIEQFFQGGTMDLVRLIAAWSIPVVLVDAQGVVRAWNRGATTLYGRPGEEAVGRRWEDLVEEVLSEAPEPAPGAATYRYEAQHRTHEGRALRVMVTRTQIQGPEGSTEGAFYLVLDLTGSKALERNLERRVAQLSILREIAEALQSAMGLNEILRTILVGATAGEGLRFNRAFLLLADEKRGELRGRVAIGPSDPEEAHRIWDELSRSQAGLRKLLREYEPFVERTSSRVNEIVRGITARLADRENFLVDALRSPSTVRVQGGRTMPDGRPVNPVLLQRLGVGDFVAVPLVAEGKPVGLLLADNAITLRPIEDEDVGVLELLGMQAGLAIERARLIGELETQVASLEKATQEIRENQERLLRTERLSAVGEMAARVVHEIRNPLVAIGGFARSLLREVPPQDAKRESIQIIVDEVRRLETIVREVLDYSRPSVPRIGKVDLGQLAVDALELLRWEVDEAGVVGRVDAEPGLAPAAADRNQLYQALVNVMRNAVHAMPHGGTLTLRTREVPGGLELAVEDTGVGIPAEVRARIFEPFFTTKATGSGLGLTIAGQIISDHRGEIHVESQVGSGTTVYIRLPAAEEGSSDAENPGR